MALMQERERVVEFSRERGREREKKIRGATITAIQI
jgi:hypothetical protein